MQLDSAWAFRGPRAVLAILACCLSAQQPVLGPAPTELSPEDLNLLSSRPTAATGKLSSKPASLQGANERKLSSKPKALAHEESQVDQFLNWLSDGGATVGAVTLSQRGSVSRLGVLATAAHQPGDFVARIPLSLLINIEHVLTDDVLGPKLDEEGGRAGIVHAWLGDVDALAVFLVRERNKGLVDSRFGPWLKLLPEAVSNPLTYSDGFAAELQASPLASRIRATKIRLTDTHRQLLALRGFRGRPPKGAFKRYLREDHVWGVSMVMR